MSNPGESKPALSSTVDIGEAELRGAARTVLAVQLLVLLGVSLYLLVVDPGLLRTGPVMTAMGAYALFLLGVKLTRVLKEAPRARLALVIIAMVGFLTAIVAQTGLQQSPLMNLYLLPVITAGLTLGRGSLLLATALVTLCHLLLAAATAGAGVLEPAYAASLVAELVPIWLVATLTILLVGHLERARERIRALSDQDELTGLLNARAFDHALEREHDSARRYQRRYALLLVDIDDLASINEDMGLAAGHQAIRLVAGTLNRVARSTDLLARYGGDSFALFLAETDREVAEKVAQRVRNLVYSTTLQVGARMRRVQVSVGAAAFPDDGDEPRELLGRAERQMRQDGRLRQPPPGGIRVRKR